MAVTIAIVDLGMGNLNSVYKNLHLLSAKPFVAKTPAELARADKILLPGVGHFERAYSRLQSLEMVDVLNEMVLIKEKPVLGICLGMQLMARSSEEGNATGLGWINTKVVKFSIKNNAQYKVPHIGWNTVDFCNEGVLLRNISTCSEFYFLHSYHYDSVEQDNLTATTTYEYEFASVIEKNNIFATQFHPEKSHEAGTQILKKFH